MWQRLLGTLLVLFAATPAVAEDCRPAAVGFRIMHLAGRAVAVWYPTAAAPALHRYMPGFSGMVALDAAPSGVCGQPVPLVVFSHGNLGCGLQSIAFTEELARHGYVVAAPDHADAQSCHIDPTMPPAQRPAQPDFSRLETWTDAAFENRRDDLEATIEGLLADRDFTSVIDAQSIGAAGHSLGGYTTVGMAGGWTRWADPRIRAVLGLSPYVMPFQAVKMLGAVHVPLMYQGGTLDGGITPFLKGSDGAYARANPPAYFVELRDADHFAWANCGTAHTTASCLATATNARLINAYGIAFFDRHLKNRRQPILTRKHPELADYVFKLPRQ